MAENFRRSLISAERGSRQIVSNHPDVSDLCYRPTRERLELQCLLGYSANMAEKTNVTLEFYTESWNGNISPPKWLVYLPMS